MGIVVIKTTIHWLAVDQHWHSPTGVSALLCSQQGPAMLFETTLSPICVGKQGAFCNTFVASEGGPGGQIHSPCHSELDSMLFLKSARVVTGWIWGTRRVTTVRIGVVGTTKEG